MASQKLSVIFKDARDELGLTQDEMSLKLGMSASNYKKYEGGQFDGSSGSVQTKYIKTINKLLERHRQIEGIPMTQVIAPPQSEVEDLKKRVATLESEMRAVMQKLISQ